MLMIRLVIALLCFSLIGIWCQCSNDYCNAGFASLHQDEKEDDDDEVPRENPYTPHVSDHSLTRYLLYDVNLNEGFNLRLDVYIRIAFLVKQLGSNWILVLPEWTNLPHWSVIPEGRLEESKCWSTYFDLASLFHFVPVIEMHQFFDLFPRKQKVSIDTILSLENFDSSEEESFEEKYEILLSNRTRYYLQYDGVIHNLYDSTLDERFEYKKLYKVLIEGFDSTLSQVIREHFGTCQTIVVSNAEVVLHSEFGNQLYWRIRQSIRISNQLKLKANEYRQLLLNSNVSEDESVPREKWWPVVEKDEREVLGGPYLAVHLRRQDFVRYHADRIPSLNCAVKQIAFAATHLLEPSIDRVYIATDATRQEYNQLSYMLNQHYNLHAYRFEEMNNDLPGEIALIDQWIASHARLFIGTLHSTFTLKIQEQREILGFTANTTFNVFCPECDLHLMLKLCKPDFQWRIVY